MVLLCGTIVLWVWSYRAYDTLRYTHCVVNRDGLVRISRSIGSVRGELLFQRVKAQTSGTYFRHASSAALEEFTQRDGLQWTSFDSQVSPDWALSSTSPSHRLGFADVRSRRTYPVAPYDGLPLTSIQAPREVFTVAEDRRNVIVPHWFVVLIWALLPAWEMRKFCAVLATTFRARQRSARGLCGWCGYDMRATPGRCPECGLSI
jgi:hypothetical protein